MSAELNDEEKALLLPAEVDFKAAKARLEAGERIKAIEAIRAKGDAATEAEKALLPASLQEYALAVSRIATDQAQEGDAELVRIYEQYDADLKVRPQAGDEELVKKYEHYQADKAMAVTEEDKTAVKEYEQYKQDLETVRKAMDDGFWGLGLLRKDADGKLRSARKHGNDQYVLLKEAGLGAELNWKKPTMAALSTLVTLAGSAVAGYAASKLTNACAEAFADSFAETFTDAATQAIINSGEFTTESVAHAFAEATAKAGAWASSKATVTGILDSALAAAGGGYIIGNLNRTPDGYQRPKLDGNGTYIANEEVQYEGEVVVQGCPSVAPEPSSEPSVPPTPTPTPSTEPECDDCSGGAVKVNIPKAIKVSTGRNKGLLFETIAKSYNGYDELSPSEKKRFRIQLRQALAKMAKVKSLDNLKSGVNYLCVNFEFTKADGTTVTYFLNEEVQDDEDYFKDKVQEYSTSGATIEVKIKSPCDK